MTDHLNLSDVKKRSFLSLTIFHKYSGQRRRPPADLQYVKTLLTNSLITSSLIVFFLFFGFEEYCYEYYLHGQTVSFENGGFLAGSVKNEMGINKKETSILLPEGGTLTVPSSSVRKEHPLSEAMREYYAVVPFKPDSIDSHLESAKWCKDHALADLAAKHYARIFEIDPDNEKVHHLLGHIKEKGTWMSPQERLESRGLIRYNGSVMSPQEKELEEKKAEAKRIALNLKKDIRKFYQGIKNGNQEAEEALKKIQTPYALRTLTELYQQEKNPEVRRLLTQVIGGIGTSGALTDLGTIALQDNNSDVRLTALEQIRKKKSIVPYAVEYFKKGLLNTAPDNEIVNRAGEALGFLDAVSAIPNLISALVTEHQKQIVVGSDKTKASFTNGRLSGFSPGNNMKTKIIYEKFTNDRVLAALRKTVALEYPMDSVDFQYDILKWRAWYQSKQKTELFMSRRSE